MSRTILIIRHALATRHKIEPGISKTQCGKRIHILNSETDSPDRQAKRCERCFTNGR